MAINKPKPKEIVAKLRQVKFIDLFECIVIEFDY